MKTKHVHDYVAQRPNPSVLTCYCGSFKHTGKFEPIVEMKTPPTPPIQHTPCVETPYHIEKIDGELVICSVNGFRVAQLIKGAGFPDDNGAFIVTAVNSHAELLEALKGVLNDQHDDLDWTTIEAIKKAISRATGKGE